MDTNKLDPRTTRYNQPLATVMDVVKYVHTPDREVWALMKDGGHLCPHCIKKEVVLLVGAFAGGNDQWLVIGWVALPDLPVNLTCAHCYWDVHAVNMCRYK